MAKEPVQPPQPPAEEPGKPYPVEKPPQPHPNDDRPLVDPVPPDKDLPRMDAGLRHSRLPVRREGASPVIGWNLFLSGALQAAQPGR